MTLPSSYVPGVYRTGTRYDPIRYLGPVGPSTVNITLTVPKEDLTPKTPEQTAVASTTSWFDQEMISGLPNKILAGAAALAGILFLSRKN